MPKSTLAGHPLHPQLIALPAGLLPFAAAMDVMHRATGRASYGQAARHALTAGLAGGVAAGIAGAMDYLTIPSGTRVKRTANVHAALNIVALAGTAINVAMRARGADGRDPLPLALSLATGVGVLVSSWYGGEMTYRQGVRVAGVDPLAHAPELAPPGDAVLDRRARAIDAAGPSLGPQTGDATPVADRPRSATTEADGADRDHGDRDRVDSAAAPAAMPPYDAALVPSYSERDDDDPGVDTLPPLPAESPRSRTGTLPPF